MTSPPLDPHTYEEVLASLSGEDVVTYRRNATLRAKLWAESERYLDLPPEQWPPLVFNWDLKLESQRFALDGVSPKKFALEYPQGFKLGWVEFLEFDANLCHFSRRDGSEELWELGFKSRLAMLIAYLAKGLPITPPLVSATGDRKLILRGDHHRYAAAKAKSISTMPIYVGFETCTLVERIVSVRWNSA